MLHYFHWDRLYIKDSLQNICRESSYIKERQVRLMQTSPFSFSSSKQKVTNQVWGCAPPIAANAVDVSWEMDVNKTLERRYTWLLMFQGCHVRGEAHSCWIGGASLQEEGVARVTDSHWFGRRRQRKLIVRAAVTENLPTVPAVVLQTEAERQKPPDCCWIHFYIH